MVPLFGAAYAAQNKGTTILYWFRSENSVLNPPVKGKIQGLFKIFESFSSTFQGKVNFQGLFKTALYLVYSSTFQACVNPGTCMSNNNINKNYMHTCNTKCMPMI